MKRFQIYLPTRMWIELKNKAKELEVSIAELIRRIIDEWLNIKKGEKR